MIQKLKELLLDEKYHATRTVQTTARGQTVPQLHSSRDSVWWVVAAAVAVLALILSLILPSIGEGDVVIVDPETFCPIDEQYIDSETYIHIDLSEELTEKQRGWLINLLAVARDNKLPARSLFSISQMQTLPEAPRAEVQRFCIPDTRNIGAAGTRVKPEHCAQIIEDEFEWDRRIADNQRDKITVACQKYVRLERQISDASEIYKGVIIEQERSYIVGSIEDVLQASNPKKSTRLIVFSDMLQNAKWFSQYNTGPDEWNAQNLNKLRKSKAAVKEIGHKPPSSNLKFSKVLICHIPPSKDSSLSRLKVLSNERRKNIHEKMWTDYFKKITLANSDGFQFIPASACAVAASALMK